MNKTPFALLLTALLAVSLVLTSCAPKPPDKDPIPSGGTEEQKPEPLKPECNHKFDTWELQEAGYFSTCSVCQEESYTYTKDITEGLTWKSNGNGTCSITGIGQWDGVGALVIPPINAENELVTSIADTAFQNRSEITSLTLPPTVLSIGGNAFFRCMKLETIQFADGLRSIGGGAFWDCVRLTALRMPDTVTSLGVQSVYQCRKITDLHISKKLTEIGAQTFDSIAVKDLVIPDNIVRIGDFAFCRGEGIETIVIPDSVTQIGADVFSRSSTIQSIRVGKNVLSLGANTFNQNPNMESIVFEGELIDIPDGLFFMDSSLSFVVPKETETVGEKAFARCKAVSVDPENQHLMSVDNMVLSKDGKILYSYASGDGAESLFVPDGVEEIYKSALYYAKFTSISLPASLKSVRADAFVKCKWLKNVTFRGTEEEWSQVMISSLNNGNESLNNATVSFEK